MNTLRLESFNIREYPWVVFFTGAGISAESGIPTYRGEGGLWHEYKPEDYACEEAFLRDPEDVWHFHQERRAFVASAFASELGSFVFFFLKRCVVGFCCGLSWRRRAARWWFVGW